MRGRLPVIQAGIINTLRAAEGRCISIQELIERFYTGEDGGPEDANNSLRVSICRLQRRGFPIKNRFGYGYFYAANKTLDQILEEPSL